MSEVWLQMSDTNIDRENPSDLPALIVSIKCENISKKAKMASVKYFSGLWMTFNEELQG